ncbi:hypothetical protein TNCV_1918751, partial [Trichonephila clavipes]
FSLTKTVLAGSKHQLIFSDGTTALASVSRHLMSNETKSRSSIFAEDRIGFNITKDSNPITVLQIGQYQESVEFALPPDGFLF